ncbi:MAG: ABC transporter ATP-binding protein [Syntrophobacter sp.]
MLNKCPVVRLEGVDKVYRRGAEEIHALKNINLTFSAGDYVSIIGPSGSGKTTLLNIIGCLDKASRGKVEVGGLDTTSLREKELVRIRREKIGFVFQQFYLLPGLTVRENIALPLTFSKRPVDEQRMEEILKLVGLQGRAGHKPNQLSGGEMQRTAIARAIVNNPCVILADEPTGNLDVNSRERIYELLHDLNGKGLTIVLVTHDLNAAERTQTTFAMTDGMLHPVDDVADYFCRMKAV